MHVHQSKLHSCLLQFLAKLRTGASLFSFWLLSFIETQWFATAIKTFSEAGVFWGFSILCLINALMIHTYGVETKGKVRWC